MNDSETTHSVDWRQQRSCGARWRFGRVWLATTVAGLLVLGAGRGLGAETFDLDQLSARAAALAKEPYQDHRPRVPDWMLITGSMTYDQWRDIRFRPDRALWRKEQLPFQVQFFHPGLYYDRTVMIHVIDADGVRDLPFKRDFFDYGKNRFAGRIPSDIGYAGLRVHAPFKSPEYFDEVIVFLGASYFRSLGRDQVYGLSARGLAIDTVEPSGEEFPNFTDFWLVTPAADATHLVIYALLDSPSVSGAYRFDVTPGDQTRVEVEARLYPRKPIRKLGVAPLTSMFFFGENSRARFDDFRPEVHDSDGLLVRFDSGEWLWRPLDNPIRIDVAGLEAVNPRGFGLIQRDRDFANHQDLETHAERRPSAWVEPHGDWGKGRVELVTIPTDEELKDNVVAYWVPANEVDSAHPLSFRYTLYWYSDNPTRPPAGRVFATRQDRGTIEGGRRFVIDFNGGSLDSMPADAPPQGVISVAGGDSVAEITDSHVVRNPAIRGWRLVFQVKPQIDEPVELRAFLEQKGNVLSETWSYALLPENLH
jgi:periplasmic glucans biosynthesis protein